MWCEAIDAPAVPGNSTEPPRNRWGHLGTPPPFQGTARNHRGTAGDTWGHHRGATQRQRASARAAGASMRCPDSLAARVGVRSAPFPPPRPLFACIPDPALARRTLAGMSSQRVALCPSILVPPWASCSARCAVICLAFITCDVAPTPSPRSSVRTIQNTSANGQSQGNSRGAETRQATPIRTPLDVLEHSARCVIDHPFQGVFPAVFARRASKSLAVDT
jgi:hypothetical protein